MPQYLRLLLVSGPPDQVDAAARQHAEHLDRLRADGKLRLHGTFVNGDGYFDVLDVDDRHEAERLTRECPLVERGLTSVVLREFRED